MNNDSSRLAHSCTRSAERNESKAGHAARSQTRGHAARSPRRGHAARSRRRSATDPARTRHAVARPTRSTERRHAGFAARPALSRHASTVPTRGYDILTLQRSQATAAATGQYLPRDAAPPSRCRTRAPAPPLLILLVCPPPALSRAAAAVRDRCSLVADTSPDRDQLQLTEFALPSLLLSLSPR